MSRKMGPKTRLEMELPALLIKRRDEIGLASKEIAYELGMQESSLCYLFKGRMGLTIRTMSTLCKLLGLRLVIEGPNEFTLEVIGD